MTSLPCHSVWSCSRRLRLWSFGNRFGKFCPPSSSLHAHRPRALTPGPLSRCDNRRNTAAAVRDVRISGRTACSLSLSPAAEGSDEIAWETECPSEDSTARLAAALAPHVREGDVICLRGPVGAGKTMFSRCLIRAIAQDPTMTVPSPTFLLQNIYEEHDGPAVHHFDLYRLKGSANLDRLGLQSSFQEAVCLIEWPEVLGDRLPSERLVIDIQPLPKPGGSAAGRARAEHAVAGVPDAQEPNRSGSGTRLGGAALATPGGKKWDRAADHAGDAVDPEGRGGAALQRDVVEEQDEGSQYVDSRARQFRIVGHGPRWVSLLSAFRV